MSTPPLYPPQLVGSPLVCSIHGRYLTARERSRGRCGHCEKHVVSDDTFPPAPRYHREPGLSLGKGWRGCCQKLAEIVATSDGWVCRGCGHETPAAP